MSDKLDITIMPDGPLRIRNAQSVSYCGERLETEGDVWLCRCGQSKNPPFCDSSHRDAGFDGSTGKGDSAEVRVWQGRTMRTHFNPNACMHVYYCKPLKELRARELAGDDDAATEIMRVVRSCPSGALSYDCQPAARQPEAPAPGAQVDIIEGGEVRVQCAFDINATLPAGLEGDRATLCRCGLSKNKPWCDGRHKKREDFR